MSLLQIYQLVRAHEIEIIGVLVFVVYLWQSFWQTKTQAQRDSLEMQWPRLVGFMRFLTAMLPAVRDAYLATKNQLVLGQTKSEVIRASQAPSAQKSGDSIPPVVTGALLLVLIFSFIGCPTYEREQCGSPRAYRCHNNQPQVCSPSSRWTVIGDETCAAQGATCEMSDAGVALCVPNTDGGHE